MLELLVQLFHGAHGVAHHVAGNFHLDLERVHVVLGVEHNLVVRQCLLCAEEGRLDLAREHVHAAHDNHVVATAANAADAADGTAALALGLLDGGNVAGAVADDGHRALAQGREHEFAFFAVRQRFKRFGVDDFGVEVVFEDVDAVAALAFAAHARAHDFGKAVDVVRLDAGLFFDVVAHAVAPRFCTEDATLHLEVTNVDAHLFGNIDNTYKVTRGSAHCGNAEVLHEHHLAFGIAAADGDDGCTEGFETAVDAETAGEQAVAVEVLHDVGAAEAASEESALHDLGPHVHVFLGVANNDGLAGGARTGVQAHDFAQVYGEQAIRVGVAQVLLHGEGELRNVFESLDVFGLEALLVHAFTEERNFLVGKFYGGAHTLQLQVTQFFFGHEVQCHFGQDSIFFVIPGG